MERDRASVHADGQGLDHVDVLAVLLLHPQQDGKAPLLLIVAADLAAGHRGFEQAVDAADVETVARDGPVVGPGAEHGALAQGRQGVHLGLLGPGHLLKDRARALQQVDEHGEVATVDAQAHVGAAALQDLREAHLDGLALRDLLAGRLLFDRLLDRLIELGLGALASVLLRRPLGTVLLENHEGVRQVHAHRVRRRLRRSEAAEDTRDLGEVRDHALASALHLQRGVDADVRGAREVDHEVALVERRHEVGAHAAVGEGRADEQQSGRKGRQERTPQAGFQHGLIDPQQARMEEALASAVPRGRFEKQVGEHGHEKHGHEQGGPQGHEDGDRHRVEELALDALERQDGHIDQHDDEQAEGDRLDHLGRRVEEERQPRAPVLLQPPQGVLDHHDGAVDEQAEVDGAQAHQARRDAEEPHADRAEEHRDRDGQRDEQRRAQVAEDGEQDRHDQHGALGHVRDHGLERGVDEIAAGVEQFDLHVRRQGRVLERGLRVERHPAGVGAAEHEHGAEHRLLAAFRRAAHALGEAFPDVGHRGQGDGLAAHVELDGDDADLVEAPEASGGPHDHLPPLRLDVAAPRVLAEPFEALDHLLDGHADFVQPLGVDLDVDLLLVAARRVDLGHVLDRAPQVGRDDEVLNGPQVEQALPLGLGGQRAAGLGLDGVHDHLAQAGADGGELRRKPRRKLAARALQLLADLLARPVDVGLILEDHDHLRKAVLGQGAHVLDAGDAAHVRLDREGDGLLDLFRVQSARLRVDDHLDGRDVRHRVDRSDDDRIKPGRAAGGEEKDHREAVLQGPRE